MSTRSGHQYHTKSYENSLPESEQQPQLHLSISIHPLNDGTYHHTAIAITNETDPGSWHTFEVARTVENGPFTANHLWTDPRGSSRLIHVITCNSVYWGVIVNVIRGVEVEEREGWNCQDYVLSVLEGLVKAGVMGREVYERAWEEMKEWFGFKEKVVGVQEEFVPKERRVLSYLYVHESDDE
jgi:hypothetical protein